MQANSNNSPKPTDNSSMNTARQPPRFFKLSPITSETAVNEISTYTEDFDPKYKITQEFKDTLLENLNSCVILYLGSKSSV